jgi:hypothetical protein
MDSPYLPIHNAYLYRYPQERNPVCRTFARRVPDLRLAQERWNGCACCAVCSCWRPWSGVF